MAFAGIGSVVTTCFTGMAILAVLTSAAAEGSDVGAQTSSTQTVALSPPVKVDASDSPALCNDQGGFCLEIIHGDQQADFSLRVTFGHTDTSLVKEFPLSQLLTADEATPGLWDRAFVLPISGEAQGAKADLLIGLSSTTSTPYSGGGAQASRLHLYRLSRQFGSISFGPELLDVPLSSSMLIRACFSEADVRERAGACHDEYNSEATLEPEPAQGLNLPILRYTMEAKSYPGAVSRSQDSLEKGRLGKQDLVWVRDETCSFTTLFSYNPTTRRFEAGKPGPDCSDYDTP